MSNLTKPLAACLSVLAAASLAACAGPGTRTFDARGTVEEEASPDTQCYTVRDDWLHEGGGVKIQAKGNTVAMAKIGAPTFEDRSLAGGGYVCRFPFTVGGVPAGEKFYTVVIEGHGEQDVPEGDLTNGTAVLAADKLGNPAS